MKTTFRKILPQLKQDFSHAIADDGEEYMKLLEEKSDGVLFFINDWEQMVFNLDDEITINDDGTISAKLIVGDGEIVNFKVYKSVVAKF